jgi:hypothetical protein
MQIAFSSFSAGGFCFIYVQVHNLITDFPQKCIGVMLKIFFWCELGVAEIGDCAADSLLDKSRYSHVLTLVYLAFGRRYRHLSEWTRLVRVVSVNTTYIMIP